MKPVVHAFFLLCFSVFCVTTPSVGAAGQKAFGIMQASPSAWGRGAGYLGSSLEQWAEAVFNHSRIDFKMKLVSDEDKMQSHLSMKYPVLAMSEASVLFKFRQNPLDKQLRFVPIGAFTIQNSHLSQTCFNQANFNPATRGILHLKNKPIAIGSEENYLLLRFYFEKNFKGATPQKFFSKILVIEDKTSGLLAVKKGFIKAYLTREAQKLSVEGLGAPVLGKGSKNPSQCIGLWPNSIYYTNSYLSLENTNKIQDLLTNPASPAMKTLGDFFNPLRAKVLKISSTHLLPYQKLYQQGYMRGWVKEYQILKRR